MRALAALGRAGEAAAAFAECVTLPLARVHLAAGRVDAGGGRGSYAGLRAALGALVAAVGQRQAGVLAAAESLSTALPEADLALLGLWAPLAGHLRESLPGMFTLGIADPFARRSAVSSQPMPIR